MTQISKNDDFELFWAQVKTSVFKSKNAYIKYSH